LGAGHFLEKYPGVDGCNIEEVEENRQWPSSTAILCRHQLAHGVELVHAAFVVVVEQKTLWLLLPSDWHSAPL